jgi:hypothetical protein
LGRRPGATWQRPAGAVADDLIHPVGVPDGAETRRAPVRWLLDRAAAGAPLTKTGNMARTLVFDCCGWFAGRGPGPTSSRRGPCASP